MNDQGRKKQKSTLKRSITSDSIIQNMNSQQTTPTSASFLEPTDKGGLTQCSSSFLGYGVLMVTILAHLWHPIWHIWVGANTGEHVGLFGRVSSIS